MATSDGDGDDNDSAWNNTPYTWIITPLILFLLIAVCATVIQVRRRRAVRRFAEVHVRPVDRNGQWVSAPGRGRATVPGQIRPRTDLEAGPDDYVPPRPGRARRWVGIRTPADRTEVEGLNEVGEAPPPYEPPAKKDDDVELQNLRRDEEEGTGTSDTAAARPPEYGAGPGRNDGGDVRTPPPAFTRYA